MNYLIPKNTSNLFEKNNLQSKDIDNFALRLNKFIREDFFNEKNEYKGINLDNDIEKDRVDKYYEILEILHYEQDSIFVKNDWKLTLGMGSGSVYNTSMTLHHVYGVPYLPAQSIKGAFRSYIIQSYFSDELFSERYKDKYSKFEEEILYKCDWFVDIFGSNDKQGKVLFFDAFSKDFKIVKDIMTPHYGEYYGDKKNRVAPTDTQNPTPITFLAVEDASFKICFATKDNSEVKVGAFRDKKVLDVIREEMINSLEIFGIGGKTSVGYGYFSKKNEPKSQLEREWDIAKNTKDYKILEKFIKKNLNSKYDKLAKSKLKLLLKSTEDEKNKENRDKLKKEEGFFQLKSCEDLNDGLSIINHTLGKKPKFNSEQIDTLREFYNKNKNKKKYAKGIYKKYDNWLK